jgi:hypothetical protein
MKKLILMAGLVLHLLACKEENELALPTIEGKYEGYMLDETANASKKIEITVTELNANMIKVEAEDQVDSRHLSFTAVLVSNDHCCAKFNLTPNQPEGDGIRGLAVTSICPENLTVTRWADSGKSALHFRVAWGERAFSFSSIWSPNN